MRLREPFQGIKMMQLHLVTNLTFFIVINFFINTHEASADWPEIYFHDYEHFASSVNILKWGHLVMFVTQLSVLYLKRYDHYNIAQTIMVLVMPFAITFPICYAIFTFMIYSTDLEKFQHMPTEVTMWLIIEIDYFLVWITSLVIFLFMASIYKYKSIRKKQFDERDKYILNNQHKLDVWSSKNSDDFLRYLKWEAFTIGYYLSQCLMIPKVWRQSD